MLCWYGTTLLYKRAMIRNMILGSSSGNLLSLVFCQYIFKVNDGESVAIFKVTMQRAECEENLLPLFGCYDTRCKISWTAYGKLLVISSCLTLCKCQMNWHCISQCCSCAPCDLRWRCCRVFLSSVPKTTGHLSQRPERVPTMESSLCPEEAHLSFCSRKRHTQLKDSILISELVLFQFINFFIFFVEIIFYEAHLWLTGITGLEAT